MIFYLISYKVISFKACSKQLSCKEKRHYVQTQQNSSEIRDLLKWDPFPERFINVCHDIKRNAQTPLWIKSLLNDHHRLKIIQGLFNKINAYKENNHRAYMKHMGTLDNAYHCFSDYLNSIYDSKNNTTPHPNSLTRDPLLIHVVRTLIPEVAHPLIGIKMSQQFDIKFNDKIDKIYDALTILVMMNTLIDDSADCLIDRDLVNMMSKIHRIDKRDRILQDIPKDWSQSKRLAYETFVKTAIILWDQAVSLIGESAITTEVLNGLDLVIECMEGSMNLAESKDNAQLWGFDQSLHVFSPGMMTHIFFEIERSTFKDIFPDIAKNAEINRLFQTINSATLNLARISNDIATLDRELMSGGFTNTLFHLCHDKISENPNDNTNLRLLLHTCCKSSNQDERNRSKNQILVKMKEYKINELIFEKWLEKLRCMEMCSKQCQSILPGPQGMALSTAIDRLCKGNENLLVMYIIMSQFKGAT